jgi:hypothetical protein
LEDHFAGELRLNAHSQAVEQILLLLDDLVGLIDFINDSYQLLQIVEYISRINFSYVWEISGQKRQLLYIYELQELRSELIGGGYKPLAKYEASYPELSGPAQRVVKKALARMVEIHQKVQQYCNMLGVQLITLNVEGVRQKVYRAIPELSEDI